MSSTADRMNVVIVGASGDLARKKIFPALFSIYCQGELPDRVSIFGFARSLYEQDDFRARVAEHLTCRYTPDESCAERTKEFLARCHYVSGKYSESDSFLDLFEFMRSTTGSPSANLLFYLAIPPSIVAGTAKAIADSGLVACGQHKPWSRVVVEKPFGKDRSSSDELVKDLGRVFSDDQVYRIDHYLGKELIQDLLVLRFANSVFAPLWNNKHIESVEIVWKEDISLQGRAGYFDEYGIVRDVIQNHLFQIMALVAMEPPRKLQAASIRDAKTQLLRSIPPLRMEDIVLGQYTSTIRGESVIPGYREEDGVPDESTTPTYARIPIEINNDRWRGVPFTITAGKGLDCHFTEIRILFRKVDNNVFRGADSTPEQNMLVIRVQPDEGLFLHISNKVPGSEMKLETRAMDLLYKSAFDEIIPEAYERLILDVIRGDKSLFVGTDELAAAWDIVTPVLMEMQAARTQPTPYEFGSSGPI